MSAPGDGRWRKASSRVHNASVVFIHHYGGSRVTSHWHQSLVNEMGYDAFAFTLSHNQIPQWTTGWPQHLAHKGKIIEAWARELATVLEYIEGPKILFSFSFPSATVAALLSQQSRTDVRGWICDGGPFLDMAACQWRLFTYGQPTPNLGKRLFLTMYSYLVMGGPIYNQKAGRWVKALSPDLPVLSLRSGRDKLVPPQAIDRFFAPNAKLNLQRYLLPEAGHLDGLKTFPQEYAHQVKQFLANLKP